MRRRSGLVAFALVFIIGASIAYYMLFNTPSIALSPKVPRIHITPQVVDLGRLDALAGTSKEGQFRIANRGTAPLAIQGFDASCGCTVPNLAIRQIPPGGEVTANVRISLSGQSEARSSVVTIFSNDPATPSFDVRVKWIEQAAIMTDPKRVDLGWIEPGTTSEAVVKVLLSNHIDADRLNVECGNPCLTFQWKNDKQTSNSRSKTLLIRVAPEDEQGFQAAELRINSDDGRFVVGLPISWKSGSLIEASPAAIFQSGVGTDTRVECRILISSADGGPLTLNAVELDGKPCAFSSEMIKMDGITYTMLNINIRSGKTQGIERHSVNLAFKDRPDMAISVPVTFIVNQGIAP